MDGLGRTSAAGSEIQASTRIELESGSHEVEFFGPYPSKMFGSTYVPIGKPSGGVIICCPLFAEMELNYVREVLLARSLCSVGFAVQRFHYRGSGNSDGYSHEVSFDSMRDDTLAAAEWLARKTGVTKLAFVGTRLAGLVAATAAVKFDGAPLALWKPAIEPSRYFREVLRTRLMHRLKVGAVTGSTGAALEELRRNGSLDVAGHSIDRRLYESSMRLSLVHALGERARPVLIIDLTPTGRVRNEYEALAVQLNDIGFQVEIKGIPDHLNEWLGSQRGGSEELRTAARTLAESTKEWIVRKLSSGPRAI
jgi:hypothetical protein